MTDWLIIAAVFPLVAFCLFASWFAASLFILWIAGLMAAVLVACIIALHIERFFHWLKS